MLDHEREKDLESSEDDLPLLSESDVEIIAEAGEKQEAMPERPLPTFKDVDPKDDSGLESVAAQMFARMLENPQLNQEIFQAERRKTGGLSLASSENPLEHPLFRLIADQKTIEYMRDLRLSVQGGGLFKNVKNSGNAEMTAVRFLLERVQEALSVYEKIQPSAALAALGKESKLRNEKEILQTIVDHVVKQYLTRDEVDMFEAPVRSQQRRHMREGGVATDGGLPARVLATAKFVDTWVTDSKRSAFVERVFATLHASSGGRLSAEKADLLLQAEAVRELKQKVQEKPKALGLRKTGTG